MGNNKHLSMKSVFSSLCIFLALLATSAEATARTKIILTQDVTFTDVTLAQWTGELKECYKAGYMKANGYLNLAAGTLATGITESTTSVAATPANVKVTFVVTQLPTFAGTAVTVASTATAAEIKTGIEEIKTAGAPAKYTTVPTPATAAKITAALAVKSTPAAAAAANATANATSSASCTGQLSLIALSIPVVAMVISK